MNAKINGAKLYREIARRQRNVATFAKEAGVSPLSVSRAIKNSRANIETVGKLAAALNIDDPCDLLLKPEAPK